MPFCFKRGFKSEASAALDEGGCGGRKSLAARARGDKVAHGGRIPPPLAGPRPPLAIPLNPNPHDLERTKYNFNHVISIDNNNKSTVTS